jgi:hypothetical protein
LQRAVAKGAALKKISRDVVLAANANLSFPDTRNCLIAYNAPTGRGAWPSVGTCSWGDTSASKSVVLFGDIDAAYDALPALNNLGLKDHFRVILVARQSCRTSSVEIYNYWSHGDGTACAQFRTWAFQEIAAIKPFAVVLHDHATIYNYDNGNSVSRRQYSEGQLATYATLTADGAKVIQLGNLPDMQVPTTVCLLAHATSIKQCSASLTSATAKAWPYRSGQGVKTLKLTDLLCTKTTCPTVVNGVILYANGRNFKPGGDELTIDGANLIAPVLAQELHSAGL